MLKISSKSGNNFSSNIANRQTNRLRQQNVNLLGGGNNKITFHDATVIVQIFISLA